MGPPAPARQLGTQPANPAGRDGKQINGSAARRMVPVKRGLQPCQYLRRGAVLVWGKRNWKKVCDQ
jgi:hypothetical protein